MAVAVRATATGHRLREARVEVHVSKRFDGSMDTLCQQV